MVFMTELELLEAVETIYDGWYAETSRVNWHDFLDRLERHTDVDLGCNMQSPRILKIKKHIAAYRKLG